MKALPIVLVFLKALQYVWKHCNILESTAYCTCVSKKLESTVIFLKALHIVLAFLKALEYVWKHCNILESTAYCTCVFKITWKHYNILESTANCTCVLESTVIFLKALYFFWKHYLLYSCFYFIFESTVFFLKALLYSSQTWKHCCFFWKHSFIFESTVYYYLCFPKVPVIPLSKKTQIQPKMTQILKAHSHSTFLVAPNPLKETQILIALFESTLIDPNPLKSFTAATC